VTGAPIRVHMHLTAAQARSIKHQANNSCTCNKIKLFLSFTIVTTLYSVVSEFALPQWPQNANSFYCLWWTWKKEQNKKTKHKMSQLQQELQKTCKNCGSQFFESSNTTSSCKFHPGSYHSTSRADISEEGNFSCCNAARGWSDSRNAFDKDGCASQKHQA